jgi:4a-hydroxytetrahydrobiopterin dehydratase
MSLLTDEEIARALEESPWERDGDAIVREVRVPDFAAAIALVNRVAEAAEAANHHPDILVHGWNRVRLTLSTHSEGGITGADVHLAGTLDELLTEA